MERLDINKVRALYESIEEVWPRDNLWLQYTKTNIEKYISRHSFDKQSYILNAGSGGNTYNLSNRMHHVDIVKELIESFPEHTVCSIEKLTLDASLFSDVICVGSVLNYCDLFATASEFSRVLKKGGRLIVEFDSSCSFEHLFNKEYNQSVALIEIPYTDKLSIQWIYSPSYVKKVLEKAGFRIAQTFRFHYMSGLHYSKYKNGDAATAYARFDAICRYIPCINLHSNNVIYTCIKL